MLPKLNERRLSSFKSKIVRVGDCDEWTGELAESGRGQFMVGRKTLCAQRIAYELFCGEIEKGHQIHTICNNRKCLHPLHMYQVMRIDD